MTTESQRVEAMTEYLRGQIGLDQDEMKSFSEQLEIAIAADPLTEEYARLKYKYDNLEREFRRYRGVKDD